MKLGRNFVIYLASSVVAGALPLALMPFLTHHLTPAEYGVMVTVTTVVALVSPVITWATTSYVAVQFFKIGEDDFAALLSTALLIPAAITVILLLLFALVGNALAIWLHIPSGWAAAIPLLAAAVLLPQFAQTVLAMRNRAASYAAFEFSAAAIGFGGTVALVLFAGLSWQGRIIATAAAGVATSLAAVVWLRRQGFLRLRFVRAELVGAFRFGAGGVAHDLANQASRLSDRLLIVALIGQATVGSYAVGVQWSSIMLTVLAAFNRAWTPFLFSALSQGTPDAHRRVVHHTYLVWAAFAAFFAIFNLVTPLGYAIMVDDRYRASIGVVFWLTLGYLFTAIYITFVDYIFYLKKTHLLAAITTLNLVLNIALSYTFITRFGATGAAMAFALTAAIVMCLTIATSHRLHPMPWFGRTAR